MIKPMKKMFSVLSIFLLLLFTTACSNTYQTGTTNLSAKPLALAGHAFKLIGDTDQSKELVSLELERAYIAGGNAQAVIDLLQKKPIAYLQVIDLDLGRLAGEALEDKPDFNTALTLTRAIKAPSERSRILLHHIEELPSNKRLRLLPEAEKSVAASKDDGFTTKASNALKLAKLYLELDKKQKAREWLLYSHPFLARKPTAANAVYFGKAAEIEAQLAIPPQTLCKLTRFLHKTKHRPIALVSITKAYVAHGYQGDVCTTDEKIMKMVQAITDPWSGVPATLDLAEAFHSRSEKEKTTSVLKEAIKSSKQLKENNLKLRLQGEILITLQKIAPSSLAKSFGKDYWQQIGAISHDYDQSLLLMQVASDAYREEFPELALLVLRKMKDGSLKQTLAEDLLKEANKKENKVLAQQVFEELFSSKNLATKNFYSADHKVSLLVSTIGSGLESGNSKIVERALKIAEQEVEKIPFPVLRISYSLQLVAQAKKHKDDKLARDLLKRSQHWYKKDIQKVQPLKKAVEIVNEKMDYKTELNNRILVKIIESNILLGQYKASLNLLDNFKGKKYQAKSLTYAAIALSQKRLQYGVTNADKEFLNALEKRIKKHENYLPSKTH